MCTIYLSHRCARPILDEFVVVVAQNTYKRDAQIVLYSENNETTDLGTRRRIVMGE